MKDEEIQEPVTNQEEDEEEIPCQSTGPNAQEAIHSIDNGIAWLSQSTDVDPIYLLNLKSIRRMVLSTTTTTSKQTDIMAMLTHPLPKQSQPATLSPLESRQATQ